MTAILVDNVSKRYRIGASQNNGYRTLRETLTSGVASRIRKLLNLNGELRLPLHQPEDTTIWALKDVSFQVQPGEVVGIIGRNGAGKSTLLKILSRITEPTSGRAEIHGRVSSLLEVGTGFHPELTGRENIFLNGAVLGMSKVEIRRKFDEIVAFSEIEKFLDTPVKRYSSGMYVRLAFAVAAHLEPEILIVDEVLAVGDASFQKKCMNKMEDVGHAGRTVVFVSHNTSAVTRLCPRTVLLNEGRIIADAPSPTVVSMYLRSGMGTTAHREWPSAGSAPGNEIVRLRAVRVISECGDVSDTIDIRRPVGIEMEFQVLQPGNVLVPNYHFFNEDGVCAFAASDHDPEWKRRPRPKGTFVSTAWIPGNLLSEGMHIVGAAVSTMDPVTVHFFEREVVAFQVVERGMGDSARGDYAGPMPGILRPLLRWTTQFNPKSRIVSDAARAELLP